MRKKKEDNYWYEEPICHLIEIHRNNTIHYWLEEWLRKNRKLRIDYNIREEWDYKYPRKQWARKDQCYYKFYIANPKDVTELCLRFPIERVYKPFEHD